MFQRDHTQNCQYFWGEGGETSAKQRFLAQLFSAKSRAEISPDGENRVGRRSEQRRLQSPEGAGPRKCLLFWGEGGETSAKQRFLTQLFSTKSRAEISPDGENRVGRRSEQATDFFKEKIGAATTAKPRRGWGPRKSLLFWGEGGMTERMRKARPKPGFQAVEKPSIL